MKEIYIGKSPLQTKSRPVKGEYVEFDGEQFYRIENYDAMLPFLMSIVSDSDHWMFISSNGGVTAGRKNPDNALFPYYTDDRIHDAAGQTGSLTVVRVETADRIFLWEPFSENQNGIYDIQRNLYKNVPGNKLIFEEYNRDLALTFQTAWFNSEKFGFVKQSKITSKNKKDATIHILDGIQNILPYGITRRFQLEYSTLADAYKKSELLPETRVGIYSMNSIPTDRAEPSEALKATTVWSTGLENPVILLSATQLKKFRQGEAVVQETDIRARRGAYLVTAEFKLVAGSEKTWYVVGDINQDAADVVALTDLLRGNSDFEKLLQTDIQQGCDNLSKIVANADGLQFTADSLSSARHFANVLFNVMRGGIFDNNYTVEKSDFILFLESTNRNVLNEFSGLINELPDEIQYGELLARVNALGNSSLIKLCYEYLPITFGRRHGDPSRPWNLFSIEIKNENGEKILNYQGNWRDIFQNWEALALSFPEAIESMITKFVNASTADGYNPYRVVRNGFDWEVLDPNDAWSYIGYWGDHQIIYLLKLLELSQKYHPQRLDELLVKPIFAYANVPYRIKPYSEILKNPYETIDFDEELDNEIQQLVKEFGTDGAFVQGKNGGVYQVNLTEKLLVPVLAKFANFIPEAGIWMNTQRPEWNDANNALVGSGVSMVTLYYMRRYLKFCKSIFENCSHPQMEISQELTEFFKAVVATLQKFASLLGKPISNSERRAVLDELGMAATKYRGKIYAGGFTSVSKKVAKEELVAFCDLALQHIDYSIKMNKRSDNLYHAYNLMKIEPDSGVSIRYLYEMLEGQVAVLSSGYLSVEESVEVLQALRQSALYREDQLSYILYPNRQLARFVEKNNIPNGELNKSELLKILLARGNKQIVVADKNGNTHFNGVFRNANMLKEALQKLSEPEYSELVKQEEKLILEIHEKMFDHQSFTGRSGTFFKYEGLGSIYWHMGSKLLLAVQEIYFRALRENAEKNALEALKLFYYEIRTGIGVTKSPDQYGAFPTDPYSHTPAHAGVQQPGMTGQVKEDILTRFGELGVVVENGRIHFRTFLLKRSEFLIAPQPFTFYKLGNISDEIQLNSGNLAFTYCQVLVVYSLSKENRIELTFQDGSTRQLAGLALDAEISCSIFKREGRVTRIDVFVDLD